MLICSFLIPMILWSFAMAISGVYIGSENTIFATDMLYQYTGFFEFLKNLLTYGLDFFYSFSYGLGGETLSIIAYYLASPFNLIISFFEIPEAIYIINLLKIGACGFTFYIFLVRKFKKKGWINVAFSTCYALMAYNIVYQLNLMWLDGVIWFPIIILGIDRLFEKNKAGLLYISLTVAIISNWYIGYMVCVGAAIYAIYTVVLDFKNNYKKFFKFVLIGVLSAGTASIVIIPSIYAQLQSVSRVDMTLEGISKINFPILDIFQKFIIGSFSIEQITSKERFDTFLNLPNIYCSIFVVLMCIIYFFNKNIDKQDKIKDGIILLVFLFSCTFNVINTIWHVGSYNIWFPYRWSFIISFFLIVIAYKGYNSLKDINDKDILKLGIIIIFACFIIEKMNYDYLDNGSIYISIALIAAYLLIFTRLKNSKLFTFATVFMICFEIFTNSIIVFSHVPYYERDKYFEENKIVSDALTEIKLNDEDIYRVATNVPEPYNYLFGKNVLGIQGSSSTNKEEYVNFLKILGFEPIGTLNTPYSHTTNFNNDILGVKYFVGKYAGSDFQKSEVDNVWENPDALAVGFMCDKSLTEVCIEPEVFEFPDIDFSANVNNPFEAQNVLASNMSGIKDNIFNRIDIFENNLDNLYSLVNESGNKIIYDSNRIGQAIYEFNFIAPNDEKIYLNIEGIGLDNIKILVNDEDIFNEKNINDFSIIELGCFESNEVVNINLKIMADEVVEIYDTQAYWFNDEIYSEVINELSKNQLQILEMTNSKLKGKINVNANKELLVFSILYDDFLKVKVDGKEVETIKLLDSLIGVELLAGEHIIELWYEPTLLKISGLVSVGFAIVSCLIILFCFREKK